MCRFYYRVIKYRLSYLAVRFILLTAGLCVSSTGALQYFVYADKSDIHNEIKEDEAAISDAKSEQQKLNEGINTAKKIVAGLEGQKNDLEAYVAGLDNSLIGIQAEISELNGKIEDLNIELAEVDGKIEKKQSEINTTKKELDKTKKELDSQYDATKKHIKNMYKSRMATYFELLFTSEDVKQLLNRTEYIEAMEKYDRSILDAYAKAKAALLEKQELLNAENRELNELKTKISGVKEEIEDKSEQVSERGYEVAALIDIKEKQIDAYEADISNREAQIKEYQDMIAAQDEIIKALERSIAEKRRRLEENGEEGEGLRRYDGGQFTFPCPSYTRISDDYGKRMHPVLQVEQFHNGVDLAAPSGSSILAAYDGTVIAADYSSTMGNYVMIDHGDGLFTIYMHASSLLVSKDQAVSKGDKIALVGSTGRSTGPHLHFGVRKDGNYVSPWNYLK